MRRTLALLALCLLAPAHAQAPKELGRTAFVDASKTVSGHVLVMDSVFDTVSHPMDETVSGTARLTEAERSE